MSGMLVDVIRAHIPRDTYDDEGLPTGVTCKCGQWSGDYFADGDEGPFDDHLADAIAAHVAGVLDGLRESAARESWAKRREDDDLEVQELMSWDGGAIPEFLRDKVRLQIDAVLAVVRDAFGIGVEGDGDE